MSNPRIAQLREKKRKQQSSLIWYDIRRAKSGQVGAANNDAPNTGLNDGYIWTHGEDNRPEVPALHCGRVSLRGSNADLLIGNRWTDGELEVITIDGFLATLHYGGAIGAIVTPTVPGELNSNAIPLTNVMALKPYPDPNVAATLRAFPGWLPNGEYWPDTETLDVTGDQTATSGKTSYVVAGIDLSTNAWFAEASEDRNILIPPGSYTDIETVIQSAAWANVLPIAAVPMAKSATDFTASDIVDLRTWGGGGDFALEYADDDISNPPTQEDLSTAFGEAWEVGQRFLGLLDDDGAGTKEYAVFSDGAQFLLLPLVVAASTLASASLTRQGTVLEAITGESNNVYESVVLYEGDPLILIGAHRVYKMWFGRGWGSGASIGISYAESYDGVEWTRYDGNPLVTSVFRPNVVHHNGTYYLYASAGDTQIDLYTATDGVTFTVHSTGVITPGASGKFDDGGIANSYTWIEGATWYMVYEGYDGAKFSIGLATSSDGISWSKQNSGNAVISETGMRGGPNVTKVGSTYWLIGQGAATGGLPTDIYRYHSTDLLTWVADGIFIARSGADEGEGVSTGQVADPHVLLQNGVLRIWYTATSDGTQQSGGQHIKLMTGKASLLTA